MKRFNFFFRVFSRSCFSHSYFIAIVILLTTIIVASCGTTRPNTLQKQQVEMKHDNDSTDYKLIVLDANYDSYLASKPSSHFYSLKYYENWNIQYVIEWNLRHSNPLQYGDFYDTKINYDSQVDYGLELNYRLYYYFQFIKDKYGVVLINRGI